MKDKSSPFKIKMLYATTSQTREKAAQMGCNWVLAQSMGHKSHRSNDNPLPCDDLPIYFNSDPKVAALRKGKGRSIEFEKRVLREAVAHAHELGMKAMIHSYEFSIPSECRTVYPSMYRPMVKEYRNCCAETRANREPCPSDPDVRDILSRKIAEVIMLVPDLDAYAFSFNECLSLTKIRHRCDRCRDIPFWQMIQWLQESVRAGVESVNPKIRLFHRLWGLNEHDDVYHKNIERQAEFSKGEYSQKWMPVHAKVYAPRNMHYKPSEDLPKYLALQKGTNLGFIAKSTWADVSVDMPMNPWIRHLKGFDKIVELSFERVPQTVDGFHVLPKQFQRAARYARDCGAAGLAGIPVHWGDKIREKDIRRNNLDEGLWRLGMLNFDVIEALMENPDSNMFNVIDKGLRKRYGASIPRKLVEYVIESQDIKTGTTNTRGILAVGHKLEEMYYEFLRYGPTVPGWEKLLSRDPSNIRRIIAEKDKVVARAEAILSDIRTYEGKIPTKAYGEFVSCFTDLRNTALEICRRQKFNFLLWAIKDGKISCDIKTIHEIEKCV